MIKILFFGSLREQLNTGEIDVACDQSTTIGELRKTLQQKNSDWQLALADNNILCAVNQTMSQDDATINDSDEIAFFPPVTGG